MKQTKDALAVLATLEDGALKADLSSEFTNTLVALNSLSENAPKARIKGNVTLKLDILLEAGVATLQASISTKVPKLPRRPSIRWVTEDGAVTTEHPDQAGLFDGPRVVADNA